MTAVMICPKCYTVYDVERRPNSEFRVSTPGMTYINFAQTPQIQAAIKPLCVNPACDCYLDEKVEVGNWPQEKIKEMGR